MDTFFRVNYLSFWKCSMIKKKRRNYSKEFKEEAVKLVTEQGFSLAEQVVSNYSGFLIKVIPSPTGIKLISTRLSNLRF